MSGKYGLRVQNRCTSNSGLGHLGYLSLVVPHYLSWSQTNGPFTFVMWDRTDGGLLPPRGLYHLHFSRTVYWPIPRVQILTPWSFLSPPTGMTPLVLPKNPLLLWAQTRNLLLHERIVRYVPSYLVSGSCFRALIPSESLPPKGWDRLETGLSFRGSDRVWRVWFTSGPTRQGRVSGGT